MPNRDWGNGEGLLGCGVGYGLLHRIPKPQDSASSPSSNLQMDAELDSLRTTGTARAVRLSATAIPRRRRRRLFRISRRFRRRDLVYTASSCVYAEATAVHTASAQLEQQSADSSESCFDIEYERETCESDVSRRERETESG